MTIDIIIAAAGKSSRFDSKTKKQFYSINGKPIIIHTIEKFLSFKNINNIIVVTAEEDIDSLQEILNKHDIANVNIVVGGCERAQSVLNGLMVSDAEYVMIHDGARPFVSETLIKELISKKESNSIVIPALNPVETVRYRNGDSINILKRENVFLIQTPQICRRELLLLCLKDKLNEKCYYTDDAEYIAKNGGNIVFIDGDRNNIKITSIEDININPLKAEENE